jgi:hypothetical protein
MGHPGKTQPTKPAPMILILEVTRQDDPEVTLVFFSTFEELTLPIKGPMEDAGVIKLYEPSPTPYVALLHGSFQKSGGQSPPYPIVSRR